MCSQYCMIVARSNDKSVLVSGSGDEQVKLWQLGQHELKPLKTLASTSDAVLTLAARDNTLFAGHQGGNIKVSLVRAPLENEQYSYVNHL